MASDTNNNSGSIIFLLPQGELHHKVYSAHIIGTAVSILEHQNINCMVLNLQQLGYDAEQIIIEIKRFSPTAVLFATQWYEDIFIHEINRKILQEIYDKCNVTIGVFGRGATIYSNEILKNFKAVKIVLIGEVEDVFSNFTHFNINDNLFNLPGVKYLNVSNEIDYNPITPKIKLDSIPFANYNFFLRNPEHKIAPIVMNKGCDGNCSFCMGSAFRKASGLQNDHRFRSAEHVFEEIKQIYNQYNIKFFAFCDDNFLGYGNEGKARALKLAELIIKSGIKIWYYADIKCVDVEQELIIKLKQSGLGKVNIGVESGSQQVLNRFNKFLDLKTTGKAINILRNNKISMRLGFIMFYPLLEFGELEENIDFLDRFKLYKLFPIERYVEEIIVPPGSLLENQLKNASLKKYTNDEVNAKYAANVLEGISLYEYKDKKVDNIKNKFQDFLTRTYRRKSLVSNLEKASFQPELHQQAMEIFGFNSSGKELRRSIQLWNNELNEFFFLVIKKIIQKFKTDNLMQNEIEKVFTTEENDFDKLKLGFSLNKILND